MQAEEAAFSRVSSDAVERKPSEDDHGGTSEGRFSETSKSQLNLQDRGILSLTLEDPERLSSKAGGTTYVTYFEGDRRDPMHFSRRTKWTITAMACIFSLFTGVTHSAFRQGFASMTRDLNCTQFQAIVGLLGLGVGFGVVPMVTTSLSEEFGRQPLYIGSVVGLISAYAMVALSRNIQTVIIARVLQGCFSSPGAAMVGGTIADIWAPKERGLPMAISSMCLLGGIGLGPVFSGWVEMNPHLEWRWIQWCQLIPLAVYLVLMPFLMKETRSSIILIRLVKKMRRDAGNQRYRACIEDERPPLRTLIYISCTRPIILLFTEPVVASLSLWIGFAWGIVYVMIASIDSVFHTLHGFTTGQTGSTFATMIIGTFLGLLSNMHQDILYQRHFQTRGPEARLHWARFAGLLFPASLFMYAWSSFQSVHWIVPMIAVVLFEWATFIIYLAAFGYLADCYGLYASSALAGQTLARSITSAIFPLFTNPMFLTLGYRWANSLLGFIALAMAPVPYALYFYGYVIRSRSKFSRRVIDK